MSACHLAHNNEIWEPFQNHVTEGKDIEGAGLPSFLFPSEVIERSK